MLQSLSAQVSYYSDFIQKNLEWVYSGVYADEVTGTQDTRAEFQRLLADCRAGKIDIVVTKSISRFARNTVTLLETVRELKALGIDVWFERENIHSTSKEGELMLTILASFAQEESRSVSENCKWRIHERFEKGDTASLSTLYGYNIKKGNITVNEEQAEVVRRIFDYYISGMGGRLIAQKLNEQSVPAYSGGRWSATRVRAILRNEKMAGDALLQKTFVVDHLEKKKVKNVGQMPKFYAQETHTGIIDRTIFNEAQAIMKSRAAPSKPRKAYPFTGKIHCGNCGKHYKRKIARGHAFWHCATYMERGKAECPAKQIPENVLFALSADVLELEVFDETVFLNHIDRILIKEANNLTFIFHDCHEIEKSWQDKSRAESWTDEMRAAARERLLCRRLQK
jgi:DNA invertase Pin-like site-specific DNA recombinase